MHESALTFLLSTADTGFTFGLTLLVQTTILCLAGFVLSILLGRSAAARSLALRVMLVAMLFAPATAWLLSTTELQVVGITIPKPAHLSAVTETSDRPTLPLRSIPQSNTKTVTGHDRDTLGSLPSLRHEANIAERFHRDLLISAIGHINRLMVFNTAGMLFLLFTTVWIGWTILRLVRLAQYWIMLACVKDQAWDVEPEIVGVTSVLAKSMEIGQPPPVLRSAMVQTPSVAGLLRPVILLPESYDATAEVLCHELAHCARQDCIWNFLGQVLVALIPFQPLLRWYLRVCEETGDFACDDYVIAHQFDPRTYARQLYEYAERLRNYFSVSEVGVRLIPWKSSLRRRIDHILRGRTPRNTTPGSGLVTTAVLACIVALTFCGIVTVRHSADPVAAVLFASSRLSGVREYFPETVWRVPVSPGPTIAVTLPVAPVVTKSVTPDVETPDSPPQSKAIDTVPVETAITAPSIPFQLPEDDAHEHITLDVVIEAAAREMTDGLEPEPADEPTMGEQSPSVRIALALDSFEPEIDPATLPDVETCIRVGNELLASGKGLSAREVFKHALALDQKDFRVNLGFGRSYHIYGEMLLAKMFYKKAILLKPNHASPHFYLGILLQARAGPMK